jgi:hypothetical protein
MATRFTNYEIFSLIFLIIYSLFKSITHFTAKFNPFGLEKNNLKYLTNVEWYLSDVWNFAFIILSLYLIFIKTVRSTIYFIVLIILLFKGLFHFITDYEIYKFLNFDLETQKKIEDFHSKFADVSDIFIGLFSLLLLRKIF